MKDPNCTALKKVRSGMEFSEKVLDATLPPIFLSCPGILQPIDLQRPITCLSKPYSLNRHAPPFVAWHHNTVGLTAPEREPLQKIDD